MGFTWSKYGIFNGFQHENVLCFISSKNSSLAQIIKRELRLKFTRFRDTESLESYLGEKLWKWKQLTKKDVLVLPFSVIY